MKLHRIIKFNKTIQSLLKFFYRYMLKIDTFLIRNMNDGVMYIISSSEFEEILYTIEVSLKKFEEEHCKRIKLEKLLDDKREEYWAITMPMNDQIKTLQAENKRLQDVINERKLMEEAMVKPKEGKRL